MVEYSVFGQETTVDWTIISDAKGGSLSYQAVRPRFMMNREVYRPLLYLSQN
jgi:hypothetical protein